MNHLKVGLVQINNSFANSSYFPYSVGLLQAYFQRHSKMADSFYFLPPVYRRTSVESVLEQLFEADVIAFSVYVWNYKISLEIAKRIKENNPQVLTLFGGPHVPSNARSFLENNSFVDIACHGEGETTFLNILENYLTKTWHHIPSVSFMDNGTYVSNPQGDRIKDLSSVPSPYLEGIFDQLVKKDSQLEWLGLWETNRGCPFHCTYCDWGKGGTVSKLYTFDTDRLKKEIEWFAEQNIEFIFCCDSNFGILNRDIEFVRHVANIKRQKGYPHALSVQNTKNATERSYAIQKELALAGLSKGVNLALQSLDPHTLECIGRKNISLNSFQELQQRFNRDNIETFSDIILALPGETYMSYSSGVDKIIESGQHNRVQFINLTVLPNTTMANQNYRDEYGLITVESKIVNIHGSLVMAKGDVQETQEMVVGTKSMPPADWIRGRVLSWMTSLLYYDKILQIPIMFLHELSSLGYREQIELFFQDDKKKYPIASEIYNFFVNEARRIQQGEPEFCRSEEWLNIYWPHDEYIFIKLCIERKLEEFYLEAERLFSSLLEQKGKERPFFLDQALNLNRNLIKQPFKKQDVRVICDYDLWNGYRAVLTGDKCVLSKMRKEYLVECSSETWNSWDDWCREVVWYSNKKGAYLYQVR